MKHILSAFVTLGLAMHVQAQAKNPVLEMKTSMGNITIELDEKAAPVTVANFLKYVEAGFFEKTIFHRVIPGFMIQGGGFDDKMQEKKTLFPPIQNEAEISSKAGLKNDRGTIAMARTGNPHSATAQFFINVNNNTRLTYPSFDGWGYAVFGKVTSGMDIADKIVAVETTTMPPHANVPKTPIIIEKVSIKK
ncbi:MAG: hypothetical protein RLZZ502_1577 [Pseudomonadota bacterium]|jgi:cyclophilin family peptidyl-prolyl cis-trans isomerase